MGITLMAACEKLEGGGQDLLSPGWRQSPTAAGRLKSDKITPLAPRPALFRTTAAGGLFHALGNWRAVMSLRATELQSTAGRRIGAWVQAKATIIRAKSGK
jgi:hypothetical protein